MVLDVFGAHKLELRKGDNLVEPFTVVLRGDLVRLYDNGKLLTTLTMSDWSRAIAKPANFGPNDGPWPWKIGD